MGEKDLGELLLETALVGNKSADKGNKTSEQMLELLRKIANAPDAPPAAPHASTPMPPVNSIGGPSPSQPTAPPADKPDLSALSSAAGSLASNIESTLASIPTGSPDGGKDTPVEPARRAVRTEDDEGEFELIPNDDGPVTVAPIKPPEIDTTPLDDAVDTLASDVTKAADAIVPPVSGRMPTTVGPRPLSNEPPKVLPAPAEVDVVPLAKPGVAVPAADATPVAPASPLTPAIPFATEPADDMAEVLPLTEAEALLDSLDGLKDPIDETAKLFKALAGLPSAVPSPVAGPTPTPTPAAPAVPMIGPVPLAPATTPMASPTTPVLPTAPIPFAPAYGGQQLPPIPLATNAPAPPTIPLQQPLAQTPVAAPQPATRTPTMASPVVPPALTPGGGGAAAGGAGGGSQTPPTYNLTAMDIFDDEEDMHATLKEREEADAKRQKNKGQRRARSARPSITAGIENAIEDAGNKGEAGGMAGLSAAAGLASKALGAVAPMATAVTDGFMQVVGKIGGFVEALNPAIMKQFNMVMGDLQATVGVALEPLMSAATGLARSFANMLLPAMESLRPVIAQIAQTFMTLGKSYMGFVSTLLTAIQPILQVFADLFAALAPLLGVFYAMQGVVLKLVSVALFPLMQGLRAIAGLFDLISPWFELVAIQMNALGDIIGAVVDAIGGWIAGLFGADVKSIFGNIKDFFGQLAKQTILLTAGFMKLAGGLDAYVKSVTRSIEGPKGRDTTGIKAASNAQIGGIAQLQKSIMNATLLAGPGGSMKTPEQQWQTETLEELKKLQEGSKTYVEQFKVVLEEYFNRQVPIWIELVKKKTFNAGVEMTADAIRAGRTLSSPGGMIAAGVDLLRRNE